MRTISQKLAFYFIVFCAFVGIVSSTTVKRCSNDKPYPLNVTVYGCEASPCDVIKGETTIFEIQFVSRKDFFKGKTLVRATTFGITVPYELPEEIRDVCSNLMYGAYCPLYPTEDVTYLFVFPIGNYPEISVRTEIYIEDQDKEVVACFVCDIKVKKGSSGGNNGTTVYQLDWQS